VFTWREALTDLERLANKPGLRTDQKNWYHQAYADVESSLIKALKTFEEADENVVDGTATDEAQGQAGKENESEAEGERGEDQPEERSTMNTADILQLFTVSEEIPAGDFGSSGVDPFPIGTVEVDCLYINGKPYSIHNTRGKKIVNLPLDQNLSVVKVKGDSMDQENILPGDYVVVRGVDVPVNGDLVLAEITGVDHRATLKRFYQDRDTITLQPRSSNPEHQPFVFKNTGDGFHVRRIVIAILKSMQTS
jgi:phage repressor protein C with HTH and peptisase S24 domain